MDDDFILPFQLEQTGYRGRILRLGPVLDEILAPHDYHGEAAALTAETAVLAVLLSFMMKYDGIFTLQVKGDGPVGRLVADVTSSGDLRACAACDREALERAAAEKAEGGRLARLVGRGYVAFTVDQGAHSERYQGIVELRGDSLEASVRHYFTQSEQILTGIRLAAGQRDGKWRAGAVMIQHVPEEGGTVASGRDFSGGGEDGWTRTMILQGSASDAELLDPALDSRDLLYRLFHEEGVRVFEPLRLRKGCRCSDEKVRSVLSSLKAQGDLSGMDDDGKIVMTCEFCNRDFVFETGD